MKLSALLLLNTIVCANQITVWTNPKKVRIKLENGIETWQLSYAYVGQWNAADSIKQCGNIPLSGGIDWWGQINWPYEYTQIGVDSLTEAAARLLPPSTRSSQDAFPVHFFNQRKEYFELLAFRDLVVLQIQRGLSGSSESLEREIKEKEALYEAAKNSTIVNTVELTPKDQTYDLKLLEVEKENLGIRETFCSNYQVLSRE